MKDFWTAALTVGGLAVVGLYVFWDLFDAILQLDIFDRLGTDNTVVVLVLFMVLVFLIALITLLLWFFLKFFKSPAVPSDSQKKNQ